MRNYITIFLLLLSFNGLFAQSKNIDSLITVVNGLPENQEKLALLVKIADQLNWENKDSATPFVRQALTLAKKLNNYKGLGDALREDFNNRTELSLDSSNLLLDAATAAYQKANYPKGVANILQERVYLAVTAGKLDVAMNHLFASQKIYETNNHEFELNTNYISIARIFNSMKRYEEAEKYLNKAKKVIMASDKPVYVSYFYLIKAKNNLLQKKYKAAIEDYLFIFEYAKKHKLLTDVTNSATRLGELYLQEGRLEKAKFYYDAALETALILNHEHTISNARNKRGKYFLKIGDYKRALADFEFAKVMADKPEMKFYRNETNQSLAFAHAGLKNYADAYRFMSQYAVIQDSVYQEEAARIAAETEAKYQNEKKEIEIAQKEKEQQQLYIILGLLLLAGLASFWALLQKNKANKLLKEKNEEKEFLIKEIHHRVKNNLQIISSLLNLQTSSIEDDTAIHAVIEGRNRVQSMGLIHQKLYMGENVASVNMDNYLVDLANHLLASFGKDNGQIMIETAINLPPLDVDTAIPLGLIINELLTNSLKYAFDEDNVGGKIDVQLFIDEQKALNLLIADNGKGLSANQDQTSTQFGTKIVKILSKKLKGTIQQVSSESGYKTHIVFSRYRLGGAVK